MYTVLHNEGSVQYQETVSKREAYAKTLTKLIGLEKSGYISNTMYVTGTTGDFFSIVNLELEEERFLKKTDQENSSHVIILIYDTVVEYFGHGNVVGESVSLDGQSFQVVGVLASDNSTLTAGNISSAEDDGVILDIMMP